MLRTLNYLKNFSIHATDGNVGKTQDFYFDDQHWVVRYLVVETGTWMWSKKVLLSPISIKHCDWEKKELSVAISKSQVKDSPDLDLHKPVSRQNEIDYLCYYGLPPYWGGTGIWGGYSTAYMMAQGNSSECVSAEELKKNPPDNHHLRSNSEVMNYHIEAVDGGLGHLQGMLVDPENWAIRYLIINTSNWWLGHLILIAPEWIKEVNWVNSKFYVDMTQAQIKNAPHYDPDAVLSREVEEKLHIHHGRDGYWKTSGAKPENNRAAPE